MTHKNKARWWRALFLSPAFFLSSKEKSQLMSNLNRRQWLRTAGLGGSLALFGGLPAIAKSAPPAYPARPLADTIRLSSNENPFGPSPAVREAMQKAFEVGCRYPYSYQRELLEMLARKEGVTTDHIVITGGSTEGLKVAGLTYGIENGEIIACDPTFLAMLNYGEQFGAYINKVPVDDQMRYDLEEIEKRVTNQTNLVFLCNPNNPTGTIVPADQLRDFCETVSKRAVVFSDEAYYDFITEPNYPSMVELVKDGQNVIVSRTFSKVYGIAGIRIGYLIARPDIAERLRKNVVAYTNVLALFAAKAALEDKQFYDFSLQMNTKAKDHIYAALEDMGLEYVPSHTNFVFFKTGRDIRQLNAKMRDHGVMVGRPFPPFNDWCRISTGTMDEVKMFTSALRKVMS
jgi:histidinol-phosphate aminotransferase